MGRYNHGMFQITRSAPVYDVVIIGSGAGGGTVTKVLADIGINVALLEAGPMLTSSTRFQRTHVALPGASSRGDGRWCELFRAWARFRILLGARRRMGARRRAVHGGRGIEVELVPVPHRRRQNESLRAHFPALCGLRFEAVLTRWHRYGLADLLRRNLSLLRQSRNASSASPDRRKGFAARPTESSKSARRRACTRS